MLTSQRLSRLFPYLLVCFGWQMITGCQSENRSGIHFTEVTKQAGIDYLLRIGASEKRSSSTLTILQTIGNGCAFLDYNNDGNLDILLVGPKPALYQGDGKGHFRNVTHQAGLDRLSGYFLGCAVGDYDNDGFEDIYLSGFQTGALLHNEAGKRFRVVTTRAGIKPQPWGTSCGWVDVGRRGKLDLFVCNYVEFAPDPKRYVQYCEPLACGPRTYSPMMPVLYENQGNGHFDDISKRSGLNAASGKGLGVAFADLGNQGSTDIITGNDEVAGDLFRTDGKMHFRNIGIASGIAFGASGQPQGGMGVDCADYDGDGRLDVIVATYWDQAKSLYHNDGNGVFSNVSEATGIARPGKPFVSFGVKWLDYDNDGWPDLLFANGNVDNHIDILFPEQRFREPMLALHNIGGKRFVDESALLGPAIKRPIIGRGLATGDFDNDGRIDVLVMNSDGQPLLLHNEGGKVGNWIGLSLVGTGHSNRDAYGALVRVRAGGRVQLKQVQSAGSYLSASDKRLLFGLGTATHIEEITVTWPDGRNEKIAPLPPGRYYTLRESQN